MITKISRMDRLLNVLRYWALTLKLALFDKFSPKMQHSSTQKPVNIFQQISNLEKILVILKR